MTREGLCAMAAVAVMATAACSMDTLPAAGVLEPVTSDWTVSEWTPFVVQDDGTRGFYRIAGEASENGGLRVVERFPTWSEPGRQAAKSVFVVTQVNCRTGGFALAQEALWAEPDFRGGPFLTTSEHGAGMSVSFGADPVKAIARKVIPKVCAKT